MWYRFEEGIPVGISRVDHYQVAFYDMDMNGDCFDEAFYDPDEIENVISYVETVEDVNKSDRTRVFVHFDDGETYELKLEKIDKSHKYDNFYN